MTPEGPPADSWDSPLAPLRDVPGVGGSFVISDMGRLLARDMPPVFGDNVLGEVGPRALRLRDTLAYAGEDMESAVLRYADYLLFLRPLSDGVLCVLTSQGVNLPAVKMAMSLCARRLEGRPGGGPLPGRATPLPPSQGARPAVGTAFLGRSRGYGF
jgi:predicted regulator of Ras-like GTPase activity (Roadblock/LC7/MglB family)